MTIDAAFFAGVDPTTLLFTDTTQEDPLVDAGLRFLENEFGQPDVNKFTELASSPIPIATLDAATHDRRDASARYREIMAPLGLGDELRVALRSDATTWGVLCLHREDGRAGFAAHEVRLLERLAPHIAEGIRHAMLAEAAETAGETAGPGVIVLEPDLTPAALTPAAEPLVGALAAEWPSNGLLPLPIYAVASRLLAVPGETPSREQPRLTLRSASGRWLTLHAAHLQGEAPRIAVVIESTRPTEAVPVMLLARGLTDREAEVAQLVVRGCSTRQIVDQLHISRYTVQDHLKAVFDKIGVRSRRELVTRLLGTSHD